MRHLARSSLPQIPTLLLHKPFSTTTILSPQELADLHQLLPSLISSNHPLLAIRLLDAALLAAPPLSSLPLPRLADLLASLPTIDPSISLLTTLRFHPRRPSPLPLSSLLISSYFRRQRPQHAAKIFAWLCRSDSPSRPDMDVYRTAIRGFCEGGRPAEAVRVAREMARDGISPTEEIRVWLCLALLGDARVKEGLDFDDAAGRGGVDGVGEVLDRIVRDWEE